MPEHVNDYSRELDPMLLIPRYADTILEAGGFDCNPYPTEGLRIQSVSWFNEAGQCFELTREIDAAIERRTYDLTVRSKAKDYTFNTLFIHQPDESYIIREDPLVPADKLAVDRRVDSTLYMLDALDAALPEVTAGLIEFWQMVEKIEDDHMEYMTAKVGLDEVFALYNGIHVFDSDWQVSQKFEEMVKSIENSCPEVKNMFIAGPAGIDLITRLVLRYIRTKQHSVGGG